MPILTVTVTDVDTSKGVAGANVYLFEGGGPIEPPENATYHSVTDVNGVARFEVYGFFRVGIVAKGYYSTIEPHIPPEEWRETWTCWGAVGVSRDITYDFPVRKTPQTLIERIRERWRKFKLRHPRFPWVIKPEG